MIGQKMKTAPPTGSHVFQRTGTTFELTQHIIKTNILTNFELDRDFIETKLLTSFHEDWKINVALKSVYEQMWTDRRTDGRRTKTSHKSSPEQSGELKRGGPLSTHTVMGIIIISSSICIRSSSPTHSS
ncbi:hypothetical protein DPMN_027146 [Dreissena polymorpha]|uniref:Uncharacterized protein n=1 Tax=Dreissena polymorpha TaxID=45954 RepID=A0A9D4LUQ1_DREPO|nr:hypothetical protein DPMN_027146 [Dreissena polymorpha]